MNLANASYMLQGVGAATNMAAGMRSASVNASNARLERQSVLDASAYDETQTIRRDRQLLGRQKANMAAAGLSTTSGTPLLLQIDSARQASMDAMQIRRRGQMQAMAYQYQTRPDYFTPAAQGLAKGSSILSQWLTR